MTTHVSTFEILAAREAAAPAINPKTSHTIRQSVAFQAPLTAPLNTLPLALGPIPPSAYIPLTQQPVLHVFGRVNSDGPAFAVIEAVAGGTWWAIEGAHTDNGGDLAIFPTFAIANGRQTSDIVLRFDGAAFTAIDALTGTLTGVDVVLHWAYPEPFEYMGLMHFAEFSEFPPDSTATASSRLAQLLRQIESSGSRAFLGTTSAGQDLFVNSCGFAGIAPEGQVIVLPSDIGNQNEQIPQNVGQNSALHFRFHPSVFIRRTDYFRSIARQSVDAIAVDAINQGSQPLAITQVVSPLVASDWLIVVDGTPYVCRLVHPANSDFRRPRDIWNNIWVPIITGSQSAPEGTLFRGFDGVVQTGVVQIADRLTYLEYARMIGFGNAFAIQRTPQDDTDLV